MTRTLTRTTRASTAVAAVVAALMAVVALAGPAAAVDTGHYDIAAEIDCVAGTIDLVAEDHDTETTSPLATTPFEVTGTNTVASTTNDTGRFDSGPLRVLTQDDAQVPNGFFVLGFEAGYDDNCGTTDLPPVTFVVDHSDPDLDVPTGGRAAAYVNDTTSETEFDTDTGGDQNTGVTIDGHEDRRWGFETAGQYTVPVIATVEFSNGDVSDADNALFDVS